MNAQRNNAPLLDRNWRYTPSWQTDIRKTFKRERERLQERSKPCPIKDERHGRD